MYLESMIVSSEAVSLNGPNLSAGHWFLIVVGVLVLGCLFLWLWFTRIYKTLVGHHKTYNEHHARWQALEQRKRDLAQRMQQIDLPYQASRDTSSFYGDLDREARVIRGHFQSESDAIHTSHQDWDAKTLHYQDAIPPRHDLLFNSGDILEDIQTHKTLIEIFGKASTCVQTLEQLYGDLRALKECHEQHPQVVAEQISKAQEMYHTLYQACTGAAPIPQTLQALVPDLEKARHLLDKAETQVQAGPSHWQDIDQAEKLTGQASAILQKCQSTLSAVKDIERTLYDTQTALGVLEQAVTNFETETQPYAVRLEATRESLADWRQTWQAAKAQFYQADDVAPVRQTCTRLVSQVRTAETELATHQETFYHVLKPGLEAIKLSTMGVLFPAAAQKSLPKELAQLARNIEKLHSDLEREHCNYEGQKLQIRFTETEGSYRNFINQIISSGKISEVQLDSAKQTYTENILPKVKQVHKEYKRLRRHLAQLKSQRRASQKQLAAFEKNLLPVLHNIKRQGLESRRLDAKRIMMGVEATQRTIETTGKLSDLDAAQKRLTDLQTQAKSLIEAQQSDQRDVQNRLKRAQAKKKKYESQWKSIKNQVPVAVRDHIERRLSTDLTTDTSNLQRLQSAIDKLTRMTQMLKQALEYQDRFDRLQRQLAERVNQLKAQQWHNIEFTGQQRVIEETTLLIDRRISVLDSNIFADWRERLDRFEAQTRRQLKKMERVERDTNSKIETLSKAERNINKKLVDFSGERASRLTPEQRRTLEELKATLKKLQSTSSYREAQQLMREARKLRRALP